MNVRRFSSPILRKAWIPYFILIFTLLLSLLTMYFVGLETKENDGLRFNNIVERTQSIVNNELITYITLLEGTSGLFAASEDVTREEFNIYVSRLNLRQQYPGIQGIGYLEKIQADDKDAFIEQAIAEGMPQYHIWPDTGQRIYMPILYIEPLDRRNQTALGYDMSTEPVRKAAMDQAVRTGQPAMSGKVTLVQEIDKDKQAGFLIYLPVFKNGFVPKTIAEREANLQGFVYSPFRADDLLRGILGGEKSPQIDFRVYDGNVTDENLLHDSRNFGPVFTKAYKSRFETSEKIEVGGHTWTIVYASNQAFDAASDIWLVPFVLVFGLLTSGVLFVLSRAQYEAGRKAEISETNLHFIAEAGKVLASSLDYRKTIQAVARMGIETISDWCSVDLKRDGVIEQLALAHKDAEQVKWAKKYRKFNPPSLRDKSGMANVFRTGKPEVYPVVTREMLEQAAANDETTEVINRLRLHSVMMVPLRLHMKTVGVMTFISTNPKRTYSDSDVAVAEEIAHRAALAIEHARLFAESEQSVKMRDDFISVASHELKTPVTSLKMYLQVVRKQLEKKGEKQLSQALGKMDQQVDKLTLLISDLLNVSRIQLGRLDFHEEPFDLEATVIDIVESIRPTTKKHTIELTGHIKKKILGDKDRIGQVITNLLTNAIKYSPEADRVNVNLSENKDEVLVEVRDYGIGIDDKHMNKIFQRFYRVADSNEQTFPGLGIGLFISQEIITRHGGQLIVESEKGKGSTFRMILPVYRKKVSSY